MKITAKMQQSGPFIYAAAVTSGEIIAGAKIKKAVNRFYSWIENAEQEGYTLDHKAGMHIVNFFPSFLNHTKGRLQGQPFQLELFQQFTMYNVFGWKDKKGKRRINTVYDKRAKKNGKSAEMAGLALYCLSFDMEMEAEVYVGATKEEQARICWNQAKQFIESPVANPALKQMGFFAQQRIIGFKPTASKMMPLGGDSKTQDGINSHVSIIDEYHAHRDDTVKENLESSSVQRRQPITWHITTAGTNIGSVCKNYEDSVIEVLEGRNVDNHLWIMMHDLDENDDWQDEKNWYKANPLMANNDAFDIEGLQKEFTKTKNQPSKIPNFKTKHLNMWVDALNIWIPNEIWKRNEIETVPTSAFENFGSFAAIDLSSTTDLSAMATLSEPDENNIRYLKLDLFCPEATIDKRSKEDRVPYRYWCDAGYITATPGEVCDYSIIESVAKQRYQQLNIKRIEFDKWNSTSTVSNLMEDGVEVSYFSQAISNMSFPTKQFERMIYEGTIQYQYNPVLEWMLSGCVVVQDANENVKVHKGQSNSHGKRVDGIIAAIMALGGSLSLKEEESKYSKPLKSIYV